MRRFDEAAGLARGATKDSRSLLSTIFAIDMRLTNASAPSNMIANSKMTKSQVFATMNEAMFLQAPRKGQLDLMKHWNQCAVGSFSAKMQTWPRQRCPIASGSPRCP